eukprot:6175183-Pleurochrysis_carterae.AAC.2
MPSSQRPAQRLGGVRYENALARGSVPPPLRPLLPPPPSHSFLPCHALCHYIVRVRHLLVTSALLVSARSSSAQPNPLPLSNRFRANRSNWN